MLPLVLSWLKHTCRTKQQFFDLYYRLHASDFEQNTLNGMTLFFPITRQPLFLQTSSGRKWMQIADFYCVFNEYSSPQSLSARCSLLAILTQMIRFWISLMVLCYPSAHTFGSRCIKGTEESFSRVDSSVPLMHRDPNDLGSIGPFIRGKIRLVLLKTRLK